MVVNLESIKVSSETKELVKEAQTIFLKHHPEFDKFNVRLTVDMTIKQALKYYIEN